MQRRLRDPRPRAARPTYPRHLRGVRAHPASSAGTPRASKPRGWRGPQVGDFSPLAPGKAAAGVPHPKSYQAARGEPWCPVRPGCTAQAVPALPRWLCPRSRRGKVCAPGRPRRPARSPPPLRGHAVRGSRAPRGGVRAGPGPPFLSPSPASSYPTAREASRRRGCIVLLLRRLLSPGWQARKAGAASPPHAASANLPSSPRPSGSAAPRSRRRPAAPLCAAPEAARCPAADPPAPPVPRALALTSPERHMSSLGLRNVPLQRRSGRGRQTLTKCALGPAQQRGRAQGPRLGLVWDRP